MAWCVVLAAALAGAACGQRDRDSSIRPPAAPSAQAHAAVLRIGGLAPPGTAADQYWQDFAGKLATVTQGRLRPTLLTRGELGSDEQVLAALRRGRVQLAVNGSHALSTVVPEFALLGAPYLFASERAVDAVARSDLQRKLAEPLARHGITLLALLPMGFHNTYSRIGPVGAPPTLRGRRLRQPTDPASAEFARAIGADLIPLPSSEIVTALQTGLIDAGTTVTLNYLWTGIADYARDLTLTRHAFLFNALIANRSWWDGLDAATRDAICTAFPSAQEFTAAMRAAESADLKRAVDAGRVRLHELSPADLQEWRRMGESSWPGIVAQVGAGTGVLLDDIRRAPIDGVPVPESRIWGCHAR